MKRFVQILICSVVMFPAGKNVYAQQAANGLRVSSAMVKGGFPLAVAGKAADLYIDEKEAKVISIAATAFKKDIEAVTGMVPEVKAAIEPLSAYPVIIGTTGNSRLVDELIASGKLDVTRVKGKWETFTISVVNKPFDKVEQALVIAGSDRRGTAFGVFELSAMIGVSPLYWWSDVHPEKKSLLTVAPGTAIVGPPSVKYRGIFINDEKWGLTPWAAKHLDSRYGNMGPNTYAKMFELLLRLKANYVWPAMVPGTKAFYYFPENPKMADDYSIVVGSSHCEQMLRNNIYEWAVGFEAEYKEKPGPWRYDLNKQQIHRYWEDRVKQSAGYESTYMIGMRGVGDSEMPGPASTEEKIRLWNTIVKDQRIMLEKHTGKPASVVPQTFCPYNEVLDWYRTRKLDLPDDVTMVWVDDNHGYVRQVPTEYERKRTGGHGLYYHFSYLGQPESYIWLCSISPSLISYELTKSYRHGVSELWVINVGDLKPADMEIQFAMELAWDINRWTPEKAQDYNRYWAASTFGEQWADAIAGIKKEYYELAASGKPEHMTNIPMSSIEADQRISRYKTLAATAVSLGHRIPARLKDAYFQLIQYPAQSAFFMNQKLLYANRSMELAHKGDAQALRFSALARAAHDSILRISDRYHHKISGGKWDAMMGIVTGEVKARFFNYGPPVVATDSLVRAAKAGIKADAAGDPVALRIPAAAYAAKKETPGHQLQLIKGLGITGQGVSVMPFDAPSVKGNTVINAPYLEYKANLSEGMHTVKMLFVPTHAMNEAYGLRYAVSVNGALPVYVNLEGVGEHWSQSWGANVRRGFMEGETRHEIKAKGITTIRVYLLDPGMVLSAIDVRQ